MNGVLSAEELEDKLLSLQVECRDCPDKHIYGLTGCRVCDIPTQMLRLERKLMRLRARVGREAPRPARDRRQAKPNAVFAKGVTR